jgi:purine-binding chemotaxis protein CheW
MSVREQNSACVFRVAGERFAVLTSIVQELVREPAVADVPLSPPEMIGIFNLRGTPTVALDAARVIGGEGQNLRENTIVRQALVLRLDGLNVALAVDEVESVATLDQAVRMPVEYVTGELRSCFLELRDGAAGGLIALLDSDRLVERVRTLRFEE